MFMMWVEEHRGVSRLLAWCFAALFLIAQSQASAHFHDESEDSDTVTDCVLCVIGSQLDDTVETDAVACTLSQSWVLLTPRLEDLVAQLSPADANARAPPVF